jgi:sugar-phosphatase
VGCAAVLFDLDGVLVDSREAIEHVWRDWAAARGRDYRPFLRIAHGRRTSQTIGLVAPDLDAGAESAALDAMEAVETRGLAAFPGAPALVAALGERWAVVTSCSPAVATLRLRTAGLPLPAVFVTAADVTRGKPAPEPYLTAAARLGVAPRDCMVVEDSPTGIAAGKAAGMTVVAVATNYPVSALSEADVRIPALGALRAVRGPEGAVELHFRAV